MQTCIGIVRDQALVTTEARDKSLETVKYVEIITEIETVKYNQTIKTT